MAINESIGELFVDIKGEVTQLKAQLQKIQGDALRTGKNIEKGFIANFKRIGKSALGILGIGTAFIALSRILKTGLENFRKLQREMQNVNTIIEVSKGQLKGMTKEVKALSKSVGIDAVDLAQGLYQAVSAGVDAAKALGFLNIAARAAKAGLSTTEIAVDGITTVLNAFHLEASESGRVADLMFETVKRGKTTFAELATSMSNVAQIAAGADIPFEQVAAAIATLTKQGVPAAQATTQIRAAIIAMNKELGDGWSKTMSLTAGMEAMNKAAGGSNNALKELVGRVEGVNAIMGLTGKNAKMAAGDLKAMEGAAGSMLKAFRTQTESVDDKITRLGKTISVILVNAVEKAAPAIDLLVTSFQGLIELGEIFGVIAKESEYTTSRIITDLEAQGASVDQLKSAYMQYHRELRLRQREVIASTGTEELPRDTEAVNKRILTLNDEITDRKSQILDAETKMLGATDKQKAKLEDQIDAHKIIIDRYEDQVAKLVEVKDIQVEIIRNMERMNALGKETKPAGAGTPEGGVLPRPEPLPVKPVIPVIQPGDELTHDEILFGPEKPISQGEKLDPILQPVKIGLSEAEKDFFDEGNMTDFVDTTTDVFGQAGEAAVNAFFSSGVMQIWQELTAEARKNANLMTNIVIGMVDAIISELLRIAAVQFLGAIFGGPIGAIAGAVTGQHGGSFSSKNMQDGGSFTVPYGNQNDQYQINVDSGERVDVTSRAEVSAQEALLSQLIGRVDALNANIAQGAGRKQEIDIGLEGKIKGNDIKLTYDKADRFTQRFK